MFLDEIEFHYPNRVLNQIDVEYSRFQVLFDLPKEHKLKVSVGVFWRRSGHLEVYESVQEMKKHRIYFIQSNDHPIDGDELAIPSILQGYLKTALGNFDTHTYAGSFVGCLLEQVFSKDTVPEETSDA
jgi:hypothetical protein